MPLRVVRSEELIWKSMGPASKRIRIPRSEPNEFRILRVVREYETISRVQLSQILDLSKATVGSLVARLLRRGYLQDVGAGSSTSRGGRRKQLVRFNPRARYLFGIDITLRSAQIAITDLSPVVLERMTIPYSEGSSPAVVLDAIAAGLRRWRTMNPEYFANALGIGVGMPGVIDEDRGVVRVADALKGWRELNLKRHFENELDIPTFAENDVKAMTIGEYLFGASRHVPNQVCLFVGDGIGAGIMVDGHLHRGITSSAGEIGFNVLGQSLAEPGQFPLLVSGPADFGKVLSDRSFLNAYRTHGGGPMVDDVESLGRAAASGDELAMKIVDEAAALISIVCIQLINTLNPEMIVLAGRLAGTGMLVSKVQERVRDDVLAVPAEAVQIVPAKLGNDGVLLGAIGLVLYDLFKPARNPHLRHERIRSAFLMDEINS